VSSSYDAEPNPMLSLEHRFMERLLPRVAKLDILDLGCGTGRWLAMLAPRMPRSLFGVDLSPEMLAQAKRKVGDAANLILADCAALPLLHASADLILCSFLASYVADLDAFATQVRGLMRRDGIVLLTDLHPATAAKLGWRRGFHVAGAFVDVPTCARSIREVLTAFEHAGLQVDAILEPEFGEPEREIFRAAGKLDALKSAAGHGAIYILQLRVKCPRAKSLGKTIRPRNLRLVTGGRVALGAGESTRADVAIEDGRVRFLGQRLQCTSRAGDLVGGSADLTGYLLLPGLVNAHDHLEFALFPRLGTGGYRNFVEWADDIHHPESSPVSEHRAVAKETRLWWGGIRNLLAGVTTVCHHNPYVPEVFDTGFAIRVMRDFRWAHSLQMDTDLIAKHRDAPRDQPFIVHLGEGIDAQSGEEIFHLEREGALDARTVIVHGLGLDARGVALLNSAGVALVWCPTSNTFLFGRTHDRRMIREVTRAALGSDSPLTAQGDLLDEVRFAHESVGLDAEELYGLVTTRAAEVLRLEDAEGSVQLGGVADFIGVRDINRSPAETLVALSWREVELVVVGGCVQLASAEIVKRLPRSVTTGLRPLEIEGDVRWIRAPLGRLFAETQRHLAREIRLGGRKVRHGLPA
jgi:cytosine/adenosine deaminase-related metal-dependent hydrolase/SAM-dependent methyltransferase